MKLSVIGGGGVRSMFLARSIAFKAKASGISELVFMDNNPEKLRIYGGMAKKIASLIDPGLKFCLTADPVEAVSGADYIITTIRVGGDDMRVRDERAALNLGVLGQETTGAAGFSFAMRSVPALKEYCELAKKYAKPGVKIFNFTNPAGLVSQALRDMGYDFTYGICDAPTSMLHSFASLLGADPSEIYGEIYGLNHLSFFNSITLGGKEILPSLIADDRAYAETDLRYFDKKMLLKKQFIPNEYLYYFFSREKAVANILAAEQTRGELIADLNRRMTAQLSEMDIENDFDSCLKVFEKYYGMRENMYMASETGVKRQKAWRFDPFAPGDGGYAGVALRFIDIINSGRPGTMIFCVPNDGALPFLEDTDIVEVTCDVSPEGVKTHSFPVTEPDAAEIIRRMKVYERNAAKAIVTKDRDLAVSALALHPLVESFTIAEKLVAAYAEMNRDYFTF